MEDFRRRVSVVRRSAASDLVHESPQVLVPSFPLHQVFGPFRSSNPSDLVHESPQALVPSFPLHQVFGPFRSSNPSDLVQRLPQNLVLSFPLHQVFEFQFSVYDVTWCFAPRKPLFLRPQAPRLSDPMGFRRPGLGARTPAKPCSSVSLAPSLWSFSELQPLGLGARIPASPYSFAEGHHVPRSE